MIYLILANPKLISVYVSGRQLPPSCGDIKNPTANHEARDNVNKQQPIEIKVINHFASSIVNIAAL